MDCYLTSSQTNNSSQSKMTCEQWEHKVCSRANGFIRRWTQPFLQRAMLPERANISSQSRCFESNAETSQAEWMNEYSSLLLHPQQIVPEQGLNPIFLLNGVSQGQVPGGK